MHIANKQMKKYSLPNNKMPRRPSWVTNLWAVFCNEVNAFAVVAVGSARWCAGLEMISKGSYTHFAEKKAEPISLDLINLTLVTGSPETETQI